MEQEEILFYKHCMQDYGFYQKRVRYFQKRLDDIHEEKMAMLYPNGRLKMYTIENDPFSNFYNSEQYQKILEKEERTINSILFYKQMIKITDDWISKLPTELQNILTKLYISKIPAKRVAYLHYYSDEKSMYRVLRNTLKKL